MKSCTYNFIETQADVFRALERVAHQNVDRWGELTIDDVLFLVRDEFKGRGNPVTIRRFLEDAENNIFSIGNPS